MQNRHAERADQHDFAGRRAAVLPERNRPGEQPDGQEHRGNRVREAELLQIGQAAPPRLHLPPDAVIEARMLALQSAERPHERHIPDNVDHLAVDRGGLVRELMVVSCAPGGEAEHPDHENCGDHEQHRRHRSAHGEHKADRENSRKARRQDVPDQHVLDREHGVRGRRDPARQRAGQPVGKVARRMAAQVAEQIAANVPGHLDKGLDADPAREPPEQIVGRDQRDQQSECEPYGGGGGVAAGQRVHQEFDAVLSADRTGDRHQHGGEDHGVGYGSPLQITDKERNRTVGEIAEAIHYGL